MGAGAAFVIALILIFVWPILIWISPRASGKKKFYWVIGAIAPVPLALILTVLNYKMAQWMGIPSMLVNATGANLLFVFGGLLVFIIFRVFNPKRSLTEGSSGRQQDGAADPERY